MSVRAPQRTLRGSFCLCFAGVDPRVRSAPRRGCSNQGLCSATSSRALRARRLGEVALAKAFVMRAFILAFARPPAAPRRRSFAVPRASRRGQTFACFLVWGVRILDEVRIVQRAPFGCYASGRTPASGRRDPRRGSVTLLAPTSGCADHRQGLCFAASPLLACARPDPRGWTPRPPEGGCYASRIHVWVRFLLPRTTFAMNANHRSQESA